MLLEMQPELVEKIFAAVGVVYFLIGVIDDLKNRKVHNSLIVVFAIVALIVRVVLTGWTGLALGVLALITVIAVTLPLFMLGALGGGDIKILAAFALLSNWQSMINILMYSVLWGAVLGLARALFQRRISEIFLNLRFMIMHRSQQGLQFQTMPFTVAILFGYLTSLRLEGVL